MKKISIFLIISLALFSCAEEEMQPVNNFAGSSWTASDEVASFIYGGECTNTVLFFEDGTCRETEYRPSGYFAGSYDSYGTYTHSGSTVNWTAANISTSGTISGARLTSSTTSVSGGTVIYFKNY